MKELSIEEKAKAYDETIEKLRNFYRDYDTVSRLIDVKEELANLIPELKENKDERIRKALIDYFRWNPNSQLLNEFSNREVFAYLEKQDKNNMGISEDIKKKLEDNLNKALEKETPESCNEFLEKQGQQKPWSEDTQQWIDAIIKDYEEWYDVNKDHRATIQVKINILESPKDRVGCEANCTTAG